MEQAVEKRIKRKMKEAWKDMPKKRRKKAIKAFLAMVRNVDEDPEGMKEMYGAIAQLDWPTFRNQCAEEGAELTPDEMNLIFDAYQMAIATWEEECLYQ